MIIGSQVNLWLWVNIAASLPVNHALADFLNHNSDTNSLIHQNNNVRFESKRYLPRYKTFASYPVFDIRSRSTLKQTQDRISPLTATTPLTLLSFPFSVDTNPAELLPNVEVSSYRVESAETTTQDLPTITVPTTSHIAEILSMRVSTSVTNSHHSDDDGKRQVRESTTELSTKTDDNTILDTQTTPRYTLDKSSPGTLGIIAYYNMDTSSDATQLETTTSAELVNSNDLTKSRTMDYYTYQDIGHVRIGKSSSNIQDEQPAESNAVTTRVPIDYLPTPESSYGKPEENYEVSEVDNVRSNGRIHGIQSTSTTASTTTEKTVEISDEAKAEADRRKSSYVVESRNYKKYRVEEETSDGFIVGEYGVFSHNDGSMRGVRYTAESSINPRLIYHALLKFLSLQ